MYTSITRSTLVAALAGAAALGACKPKQSQTAANDSLSPNGSVASTTPVTDTSVSAGAIASKGDWTDASILGFMNAANATEVSAAEAALNKVQQPAVKQFAQLMIADHKAMLADGRQLAQKMNVRPDSTADPVKDLKDNSHDELKDLNGKKAGKDFDEDYMEKQVDDHQKVLDKLQDASKATQNADLKSALNQAIAKVQSHLDKAKDIKDHQLKS